VLGLLLLVAIGYYCCRRQEQGPVGRATPPDKNMVPVYLPQNYPVIPSEYVPANAPMPGDLSIEYQQNVEYLGSQVSHLARRPARLPLSPPCPSADCAEVGLCPADAARTCRGAAIHRAAGCLERPDPRHPELALYLALHRALLFEAPHSSAGTICPGGTDGAGDAIVPLQHVKRRKLVRRGDAGQTTIVPPKRNMIRLSPNLSPQATNFPCCER